MSYKFTETTNNPKYEGVLDVTPQQVLDNLQSLTLIDVREPDEYTGELGHIKGAKLIPLGSLETSLSELPKEQPIVFICRSGNRSGHASLLAKENGINNTFNMFGGMILWNENDFATTKEE